jgi:hypothetical protein
VPTLTPLILTTTTIIINNSSNNIVIDSIHHPGILKCLKLK